MGYPETFTGFQIEDPATWNEFHKNEYTPKAFGDYDVDIKIQACGICGSDLLTVNGGWGEQKFPLCVGHEIVGEALRVGPKVTLVKPGQRVGVGAQSYSCLQCRQCKSDNESYCLHQLDTYGAVWPDTGIVTQGGYASHVRTHEHFVFPIPETLKTEEAAPLLCAGLTAYSPLVRNGAGPGKKVGIVGLGGIGHFAVMFAKALGAETWVISRTHAKEADAKKMGADGFLATADKDWNKDHLMTFDLIINTASSTSGSNFPEYLAILNVHGRWVSVGIPDGQGQIIDNSQLVKNGVLVGGSHLGSRKEALAMLDLAAEKGIKSWVETIEIGEEGLKTALTRLHNNDVKYRFTLVGYDECFGA
ncbi:hypothetical protein DSL72_000426 [Monilinia vaccinii-corymbosi]|uniref:alcohol dehydrogenase (NADP(+)) n=1 Tax=Monilinia vaccinii-corymbosi TaxID=61207 RepID=A0A8A3P8H2_9HELO|nr:hypothetical protein DSL72_000426 [Monilinia vaccinii-corymbosi]